MLRTLLAAVFGLTVAALLVLSMFEGGDWVDANIWWWLPALTLSAALAGESWYGLAPDSAVDRNNRAPTR